jgi:2-oxoglutarate ferredoxin oxidoreductase subunit delta
VPPPLIYNDPVATTSDIAEKQLPVFDAARCKRCGICSHFCPRGAIGVRDDGTPFLAKPEACNSCGLCKDMCPDWAIHLSAPVTPTTAAAASVTKAPETAGVTT